MNIIFDVSHPAHINFFRHSMLYFNNKKKYNVYVTCLRRGNLPKIAKKELKDLDITFVGRHRGTTFSIIFEANIRKFFELIMFAFRKKIQIGVSAGNVPLGTALTLLNKKSILFDDDPERDWKVFLETMTATVIYTPPIFKASSKIKNFNALKEWAYLSPKYFEPNIDIINNLNLDVKGYVFIREVSTNTLNYHGQPSGIILNIAKLIPENLKVVLSLEDKNLAKDYPNDWIILEEPVLDIHSLIYYSFALISSGDSMAREGAQLGVPSVYCGFREMKANKILVDLGMIFEMRPEEVPVFIQKLIDHKIRLLDQDSFRQKLENEWDDLTELIIKKIESYERK